MPILPEVVKGKLHTIEILTAIDFLSKRFPYVLVETDLLDRRVNNVRYVGYVAAELSLGDEGVLDGWLGSRFQ